MNAQLRHYRWASVSLAAVLLAAASTAHARQLAKKRALPPKFDPTEVEQIFFTDARKVLVGARPVSNPTATVVTPEAPASDPSPSATAPAAASSFRWSKLISPETLADEVKTYPPLLTPAIQTPSQFKGNGARSARRYFSTLAAMFEIIAQHDGDVRWKDQAAAARQLFARAGFNAKSDNENVFNEARLRADDLTALVRGERIAAPPTPNIEPQPNFNDQVSNRPPLMWRLERAQQDRLAEWTANAAAFNKNLARVKHEAEIAAALAQVIQHKSYTDADSESYIEYAREVQNAALAIREAAEKKDAAAAGNAARRMKQACDNCHADYRGG
jgi:hypothetical protein